MEENLEHKNPQPIGVATGGVTIAQKSSLFAERFLCSQFSSPLVSDFQYPSCRYSKLGWWKSDITREDKNIHCSIWHIFAAWMHAILGVNLVWPSSRTLGGNMTQKTLWAPATSNYGSLRPRFILFSRSIWKVAEFTHVWSWLLFSYFSDSWC